MYLQIVPFCWACAMGPPLRLAVALKSDLFESNPMICKRVQGLIWPHTFRIAFRHVSSRPRKKPTKIRGAFTLIMENLTPHLDGPNRSLGTHSLNNPAMSHNLSIDSSSVLRMHFRRLHADKSWPFLH